MSFSLEFDDEYRIHKLEETIEQLVIVRQEVLRNSLSYPELYLPSKNVLAYVEKKLSAKQAELAMLKNRLKDRSKDSL
jgi:CO dehydrogenase/acetyl-CoA synthase gamma subunit (corrinoid Fe-S protein)